MSTRDNWRPSTMAMRVKAGEVLYRSELINADWMNSPFASVPPYCSMFPNYLAWRLTEIYLPEVLPMLKSLFPQPDLMDCQYLRDVLSKHQAMGIHDFKPIELQQAPDNGISPEDDPYKEYWIWGGDDKYLLNTERLSSWLLEHEEQLNTAKTDEKKQLVVDTLISPLPFTVLPGLKWHKDRSIADIAELFYRLAKGGFIDLREYREPNDGSLSALCRHICHLFQVPPERSKDPAAALKAALSTLLRGDEMHPGPVNEQLLWEKPLDRRPGNPKSARIAAVIPSSNGVGGA